MKNTGNVFLVVMLFTTLGLWGWAQQKNGNYASRLRELEARCAKMEADHRGVVAAGDRNQKRVAELERERRELIAQVGELRLVAAERDELRGQLTVRTGERDELREDLTARVRERDDLGRQVAAQSKTLGDLREQLAARTKERDQVALNMQLFSRELQSMLGRMETVLNETPRPGNVEATPASRRGD